MKALAALLLTLAAAVAAAAPTVQTRELALDGQRVTLDVHAPAGPPRGAAILSHGFTRSRSTLAGGAFGPPVPRVMLVGFSAGGLSSLLAAEAPGVVGYVGLDPFDRTLPGEADRLGLTAARTLRTEALLLRAPPPRCNAEAVAAPWATTLPRLWRDELIAGASHCDFESPSDWMCRLACGDTDPARQQRVRQGLLDAAARWLP